MNKSLILLTLTLLVLLTSCTTPVIVEDTGIINKTDCSKKYDLVIDNQSAYLKQIQTVYWYTYSCNNTTMAYIVQHEQNTTFEFKVI